jgi:FAD/FMN-containing dehydrogenase
MPNDVVAALPAVALRSLLGADNVIADPTELTFYSTDVYRRADVDAALVIRPGTTQKLAAAVKICADAGCYMVARGGGLSYTGGFLPTRANTVIVDMRGMDRIVEINEQDMYITVECGANWKTLYEALKKRGLRTPYFGPMSGFASTVGGALSQGSVFLGSTQYGTTADSVLSLDVVLADGTVLTTGSAGSTVQSNPFFRNYGPDLTGLFLHDSGALGFKARATLRLLRMPEHTGCISFTFAQRAQLFGAMSEIARRGLATECYGADPYIWGMRLWDDDVARDVKRFLGVIKSGRNLVQGLKNALRMAVTGRNALKGGEFAMNIAVDGRCAAEVEFALDEIRKIAAANGQEIEPTVPRAVRGAPFLPPDDILGPNGHRWAPSHGIVPHSRIVALGDALQAFFTARSDLLKQHGIEWGFVAFAISTTSVLLEPMLYWPGTRELYHQRMITPARLAKIPDLPVTPDADAVMRQLRIDLVALWRDQGCAHLQIGKTYHYFETRQPPVQTLLKNIKALVDPRGLINPDALGLHA